MLRSFLVCFIPLFVAVDPFGVLPLYVGLTASQTPRQRRTTLTVALGAATILAVLFFAAGHLLLRYLSVEVADFRIAGGILLLLIAIREIFAPKSSTIGPANPTESEAEAELGLVPLAIPLIVGPAVLATGLTLVDSSGYWTTTLAFLLVMVILAAILVSAHRLMGYVRMGIWVAMSKIVSILLAAIAVSFIRDGVARTLESWKVMAP